MATLEQSMNIRQHALMYLEVHELAQHGAAHIWRHLLLPQRLLQQDPALACSCSPAERLCQSALPLQHMPSVLSC